MNAATAEEVRAAAGAPVLLRAWGLSHSYGGLRAVDGVSLELREGEVHALIGPNGAGKTTLLALVSGFLGRPPKGAGIEALGRRLPGGRPWRAARAGVGRSFQRGRLFVDLTAEDNVLLAARGPGWGRGGRLGAGGAPVRRAAREALARVGLEGRGGSLVSEMSHGERRLVELAMSFAGGARVLLLDEPLAGLGAGESQAMASRIRALAAGRAVLMIEHDLEAVFRVADRITAMAAGRVVATGPPDRVRAHPEVRAAYLPEPKDGGEGGGESAP